MNRNARNVQREIIQIKIHANHVHRKDARNVIQRQEFVQNVLMGGIQKMTQAKHARNVIRIVPMGSVQEQQDIVQNVIRDGIQKMMKVEHVRNVTVIV